MEIKKIKQAAAMLPLLEKLENAKQAINDNNAELMIHIGMRRVPIPTELKYNILNIIRCEYERVRKEIEEL